MGGATDQQAKENTRQEQGKRREAERSFEGHFHFLGFGGCRLKDALRNSTSANAIRVHRIPPDAALGLEGSNTPALARLMCLEGADESSYQKAENHLQETGGIEVSARQIQRLVQQVGAGAQTWQEREAHQPQPGTQAVPIMYLSGDGSGVPMRTEELEAPGSWGSISTLNVEMLPHWLTSSPPAPPAGERGGQTASGECASNCGIAGERQENGGKKMGPGFSCPHLFALCRLVRRRLQLQAAARVDQGKRGMPAACAPPNSSTSPSSMV